MKHLCDLCKKGVDKNLSKILEAVDDPKFLCQKCIRVSNDKERLCKPAKLSSLLGKKK